MHGGAGQHGQLVVLLVAPERKIELEQYLLTNQMEEPLVVAIVLKLRN